MDPRELCGAVSHRACRPLLADAEQQPPRERRLRPVALLPDFRTWFSGGEGRERSPFRELHEELVTESGLLRVLTPEDVTCTYLWTVEEEAFTDRQGQTGLLTHYFLEIYDVKFNTAAALGPLLVASEENGAVWLPAEQIDQQGTIQLAVDGALREVRLNGQIVLHPPQTGTPRS
jgi:hypothetical protein